MSLTAGELEPGTYRSSLDSCPFWQRPFLRSGDRYTLPVAGHALRSPLDAFEQRLLSSSNLFSQHRAKVVDELALGYDGRVFPAARSSAQVPTTTSTMATDLGDTRPMG